MSTEQEKDNTEDNSAKSLFAFLFSWYFLTPGLSSSCVLLCCCCMLIIGFLTTVGRTALFGYGAYKVASKVADKL